VFKEEEQQYIGRESLDKKIRKTILSAKKSVRTTIYSLHTNLKLRFDWWASHSLGYIHLESILPANLIGQLTESPGIAKQPFPLSV
jgi:hypothetical protein